LSWSQTYPNSFSVTQQTQEVLKNHDNEHKAEYTLLNSLMAATGHAHTGNGSDGALIDITGFSTQITALWNNTWTEKFIMINPVNGYVSPLLPLTRNAVGQIFYFYPQGTVSSATLIYFFTGTGSITLTGSITNVVTTIPVSSAITFTGTPYALIDIAGVPEIVQMTAGSGTTNITVVRGQLGTTAVAHSIGAVVLNSNPGNVSISSVSPVSWNATSLNLATKRDLFAYSVSGNGLVSCTITAVQEWGNR
jgi:hypothetical protein